MYICGLSQKGQQDSTVRMKLFLKLIFKNFYSFLTRKEYRTFHWLVFRYSGVQRFKRSEVRFSGYRLSVPDTLSFLWQYKEIFSDQIYRFHTTDSQPIIYDCGANLGLSCIYHKRWHPGARIKAFEADPAIAKLCQDNFNRNGLKDIELIASAVWTNEEGIELVSEGSDGASTFLSGHKVRVPSVDLKKELSRETRINLLKMDIEGAETEVLLHCGEELKKVEHLFVEFHSYKGYPQTLDQVLGLLNNLGFRYHIHTVNPRATPLLDKQGKYAMDVQLNVFAWRA